MVFALVGWTVGSAAVPEVAVTDLRLKRRVAPVYEGASPGRCLGHVLVDEEGRAADVQVRGCPEPLAGSTLAALRQWRWRPYLGAEGQPIRVYTAVLVNFRIAGQAEFQAPTCTWDLALGEGGALTSTATAPAACAAFLAERVEATAPLPPGTCTARFTLRTEPTFERCTPEHEVVLRAALLSSAFPTNEPQVVSLTAADERTAPDMFTLAELRDGFGLGTRMRLRIEEAGSAPREERWEVTEHGPEGCTLTSTVHDPETGALLEDLGASRATWEQLLSHGRFPASQTEIADDTVTVPAGTFATRRYTVRLEDGSTRTLHFASRFPGPPVSLVEEHDGMVTTSMILLERTTK